MQEDTAGEVRDVKQAAALLGGKRILGRELASWFDVHETLSQGLPSAALIYLVDHGEVLKPQEVLATGVGMSLRTYQRFKRAPKKVLNEDQSGRTWRFAQILARAAEVLGSREEAERWLERPAVALDQRRPIDLLRTPAGTTLVEELLERLEYGVYT
jgi:putative toxin-antitoxin system antitoxin component (TIGR02293 family)